MVFPQRFRFYFTFLCCHRFISVWFVVDLLRRGVIRRFVAVFYLCGGDLDRQSESDQFKISNYGCQYVEELES